MRIPFRHLVRALEVLAWTAFFAFGVGEALQGTGVFGKSLMCVASPQP